MNDAIRSILLPYQQAWVGDLSRFKIGLWSRQTGKSFATACEAVLHCQVNPGTLWVVLSAGERQAIEWMRKAKQWAEAVNLVLSGYEEIRPGEALMTRAEITFDNKSRIIAIPANPDTARGYSANLILDEFAIHEKPWDIWAAIYPSITNPLAGEKLLRIVSTPKGMGNKFADLWHKNDSYSKHKVTIEDAVRAGLPVNLAELRAGVDDPDIWAQEYLCEFIDTTSVLLPYDVISRCELPKPLTLADLPADAQLFVGMDVGRSKDLSVILVGAKLGDTTHVIRQEILRRMPFAEQLRTFCDIAADRRVRRACIDATGIGAMLAEEAKRALGGKVEPVTFNVKTKGELYTGLRRAFDDLTVRIPAERDLREDLHAIQRNVSTGGTITYSAPRNDDGHSDRAAALALMLHAANRRGCDFIPRAFTFIRRQSL